MSSLPFASIIIPALNEEAHIKQCLDSTTRLEYPRSRYEVIVVDNGSTDNTVQIARSCGVKVIERPGLKIGGVRNAGYAVSSGDIIAFTDADCVLPPDWLATGQAFLIQDGVGAVGGRCLVEPDSTWLEKCWVTSQAEDVEKVKNLAGSSFMTRREVFEQCGGFAEDIVAGEDDRLSALIRLKGYCLLSLKGCRVTHLGYPKTFFDIMMRQVWHSQNSFEIKDGVFDKMFLATNLFCMCTLLLIIAPFWVRSYQLVFWCLVVIGIITALPVIRKVGAEFRTNKNILQNSVKFLQLYTIYLFFFLGRSIGLLINYFCILRGK